MKIAVTFEKGEVFQHFGHSSQFKIYTVEEEKITSSQVADTNGSGHGALSGFLKENKVDVLICGGIGGGAINAVKEAGIKLIAGAKGDADAQVQAYLEGALVHKESARCAHHEHHGSAHDCSSQEGHSCGK